MDESEQSLSVTDFECGYCQRKFTKKEHLRVRRKKWIYQHGVKCWYHLWRHERARELQNEEESPRNRRFSSSLVTVTDASNSGQDTGLKPFLCTVCQKRFSRGDVLNQNVKGHRGSGQSPDCGTVQVQADSTSTSALDVAASAFPL